MRFHCATVLVVLSICVPYREHCWRCNANGRSENALSFLHYKENTPCYGNNHKKRFVGSIARYNSITTIYIVRNLQIFNAGHFFSSKHCNDLQRRSFGLPWFSTKTQIITLFYLASRDAPIWYNQLNMFLKMSGRNCPVALPVIAGSVSKTCQYHW